MSGVLDVPRDGLNVLHDGSGVHHGDGDDVGGVEARELQEYMGDAMGCSRHPERI